MLRTPQGWEWLILLAIVLLLFGARRLPDLARSVGRSMRIFRSEVKEGEAEQPEETPRATPGGTTVPEQPADDDDGGRRP